MKNKLLMVSLLSISSLSNAADPNEYGSTLASKTFDKWETSVINFSDGLHYRSMVASLPIGYDEQSLLTLDRSAADCSVVYVRINAPFATKPVASFTSEGSGRLIIDNGIARSFSYSMIFTKDMPFTLIDMTGFGKSDDMFDQLYAGTNATFELNDPTTGNIVASDIFPLAGLAAAQTAMRTACETKAKTITAEPQVPAPQSTESLIESLKGFKGLKW